MRLCFDSINGESNQMILYNSEQYSPENQSAVLKHFGSMLASARRVESMFAAQQPCGFFGGNTLTVYSRNRPPREESCTRIITSFSDFAQAYVINEYQVDVSKPLRLHDCWTDDPIGSGGLEIFRGNDVLSKKQFRSLSKLFSPFSSIIYPIEVSEVLGNKTLKVLRQKSISNPLFKSELIKRKGRISALGLDYKLELPHELVWIDLTLKLRLWALENDFDSFVYKNNSEDDGKDSVVTLKDSQIGRTLNQLKFNHEKYLDIVSPIFQQFLFSEHEKHKRNTKQLNIDNPYSHHHMFWAGQDPMLFWD